MAARDELDIPMPAMAPSYRVQPRRREEMDSATRRLAAFAGVIGGALLLLVGVWTFTGHRSAGVPVIEPDSRPLRVKPANPGGLQVDGANDSILSGESDGKQTVAPPPETPAPQALQQQEQASSAAATQAPVPPAAPAAAANAALPAPAPAVAAPESQPSASLRPHPAAAQPKPIAASAPVKTAPPLPAAAVPHATHAAAAVPVPSALSAAVSGTQVQLASVHSEEAAMAEWQRLAHKFPELLGSRHPVVSKTDIGGKPWWRLRTSGFADVTQATLFCERMKTQGGGCTVAAF